MEKYSNLRLLFWCVSMVLVLNSCSSESGYAKNEKVTELAKWAPFEIKIKDQKAIVGFVESPVPFEFDLTANHHKNDIRLIENVIGSDTPVRIFVYKGTSHIAKIEPATQNDILNYRKDLVSANSEIMNRPDPLLVSIFPDEAALANIYTMIVNNSCANTNFQEGCMTFQYATDGCNARAHKMKQLLNANGYNCQKHYVFGGLLASAGTCCVQWIYHTAPLVLVRNSNNIIEERILDPSLFATAVTPEVWRAACQNMACVLNPDFEFEPVTYKTVPGIVFHYNPSSMSFRLDSDYFRTDCTLEVYQHQSGCAFPNPIPPDNCQN